ncbi:hypothetical protein MED121_06775 [Marinomonas sp. MED121]|uniref:hypothetical protein n=1 Tax=Marinomonas sp. MED121 TaxID=314277 RepID=UPI00006903D4|nr:hypothetical protein [Marinomonas sp. MED121]EAQ66366.1 hypothetical protein MED121_06775 [Marinomonas sp. MED121]
MQSDPKALLKKNKELIQSNDLKVTSHVQRPQEDWFLHTVMIEGYEVPFRFKRQGKYQNLKGARVNLTYYPSTENVAGISLEVMRVVRIKRS